MGPGVGDAAAGKGVTQIGIHPLRPPDGRSGAGRHVLHVQQPIGAAGREPGEQLLGGGGREGHGPILPDAAHTGDETRPTR